MSDRRTRVRWHPVPAVAAELTDAADGAAPGRLEQVVLQVGVPVADGAETAVEQAVELLQLAAEVEHALLVQYLYAAVSISAEPGPDGVPYREKLIRVAVQEMGHLATVQNLLLLLGGRDALHLQRDVKRALSDHNPVPFVLEPVSAAFLAKAVAVEMPAEVPAELADEVAGLVASAEHEAGVALHRVGVLYALLGWMFRGPGGGAGVDFAALAPLPDQPYILDADLRDPAELAAYEASREEWQVFEDDIILPVVHTRAEAVAAVDWIAEQGEGLADLDDSHFGEFLELHRALDRGFVAVHPIARQPTVDPGAAAGSRPIVDGYTRLWGEVFALQYQLLILSIQHAIGTSRADEAGSALREGLAGLAVRGMRRIVVPVSDLLAGLPLGGADPTAAAGPPYDLDPSVLASHDPAVQLDQHRRMLDRLVELYRDIENRPEFPADPAHETAVANLRAFDRRRRDLVAPLVHT